MARTSGPLIFVAKNSAGPISLMPGWMARVFVGRTAGGRPFLEQIYKERISVQLCLPERTSSLRIYLGPM
jgi:hypothetical protein